MLWRQTVQLPIIALFVVVMNISYYWALHFYTSIYDAVCLFGKSKRYNFFLSLLFCAEHRLFWNLTPHPYYILYSTKHELFRPPFINGRPRSYFDNLISSALLNLAQLSSAFTNVMNFKKWVLLGCLVFPWGSTAFQFIIWFWIAYHLPR